MKWPVLGLLGILFLTGCDEYATKKDLEAYVTTDALKEVKESLSAEDKAIRSQTTLLVSEQHKRLNELNGSVNGLRTEFTNFKDGEFAVVRNKKGLSWEQAYDELAGRVNTVEDRLPPTQNVPMGDGQQGPNTSPAIPEQSPGVRPPQYSGPSLQQASYVVDQRPVGGYWMTVYCKHRRCRYLWQWTPGYPNTAVFYQPYRRRCWRCRKWCYEWVWERIAAPPGVPVPW